MDGHTAENALEIYRFLGSLGVGGTIAAILFFFYRRDVKSYTELWQAAEARAQKQTEIMIAVVRENAIAVTVNTEVIKSLHRRLDHTADEDEPKRRAR